MEALYGTKKSKKLTNFPAGLMTHRRVYHPNFSIGFSMNLIEINHPASLGYLHDYGKPFSLVKNPMSSAGEITTLAEAKQPMPSGSTGGLKSTTVISGAFSFL